MPPLPFFLFLEMFVLYTTNTVFVRPRPCLPLRQRPSSAGYVYVCRCWKLKSMILEKETTKKKKRKKTRKGQRTEN